MSIYCYVRNVAGLDKDGLRRDLELCRSAAGAEPDGWFHDDAASGAKTLLGRAAGGELHGLLESGDVVVATRPEQLFRSGDEMDHRLLEWSEMGVAVRFAEQVEDDARRLDSRLRSASAREAIARVKAAGNYVGGRTRVGFARKRIGGGRTKAFPDREIAPLARLVAHHRDHCGIGFSESAARLRECLKRRGVSFDERFRWDRGRVRRLYENYARWYGKGDAD